MDYAVFKLLISIFGLIFTFVVMTYFNIELYRAKERFYGTMRHIFSNLFVIVFLLSWLMFGFYIIVIFENSFGIYLWNKYFGFWFVPLTVILVVISLVYGIRLLDELEVLSREGSSS
ncbi:MAG: hypothetical protein KAT83_01190 [Candidatus Aenigmarchaeota archaeon]|nr:hypothetical protein [Candidatus Aenigmarchaeota archaeon]